jgi:hypothetical protein
MNKYVIEREIPGAGSMSAAELQGVSAKSNQVLKELGPEIQWMQSYVTDDKIYCVYFAESEELVAEHARCLGVPCDKISRVRSMIDPTSGN